MTNGNFHRWKSIFLSVVLLFSTVPVESKSTEQPYDIVITNGHIIDGTGSPWYSGDLAIRDGKIAAIGNLHDAARSRTIDARGQVVAPGFIDMLGQSEYTILVDPRLPSKIYQGITTEITGEGESIAPLNDAILKADQEQYDHYRIHVDWRTFREYFSRLEKQHTGINIASYVGATRVRRMVLGDNDVQPTLGQLEQMREIVRQAMRDGAVGVSTSLEYAPAPYAKTEELIALAAEASRFGGIYATHMRNEGTGILAAIDEALRIGREARIPVEIWHLKVGGKPSWGHMPEVVAKINSARAQGLDVTADTYAYTAWFNDFSAFIPAWAHDGGNAKLIERLKDPASVQICLLPRISGTTNGRRSPVPKQSSSAWYTILSCFHCKARRCRRSQNFGTRSRWMRSSTCSSKIMDSLPWPSSECRSRTFPSLSSSPGSPSITTPPALRPKASSDGSILIRARTARSRASFANTSARNTC